MYVTTLLGEMMERETRMLMPPNLEGVLDQFVDQMLENMPKTLPSIWAIDHHIELELGARLVAKAPY